MEQEKNNQIATLNFNMNEIEDLLSLLDPNEEFFQEPKILLKELKMDKSSTASDDRSFK